MKIRVNYDLIDKINESKTGVSLIKTRKNVFKYTFLFFPADITLNISSQGSIQRLIFNVLFRFGANAAIFPLIEKHYSGHLQETANNELKNLARLLRENYIKTDFELLQKAYQYETNYSLLFKDNNIKLKQEKYIMVPVNNINGEDEVSLVQEHFIGSEDYDLSYGSPKKILKPTMKMA